VRGNEAPLAIVVDEYGGTSGIITVTDILSAVVGEFAFDALDRPDIVQREDGSWLMDGRVSLERLTETVGWPSAETNGDFQTLAGLVMHGLGRIPAVGDRLEANGFAFEVMDMDARRVDRVLVSRLG
jgi:putative hemolysin